MAKGARVSVYRETSRVDLQFTQSMITIKNKEALEPAIRAALSYIAMTGKTKNMLGLLSLDLSSLARRLIVEIYDTKPAFKKAWE